MKLALTVLACLGMFNACDRPNPKPSSKPPGSPPVTERPHPDQSPGDASGSASPVSAQVEAAMTEFITYSEGVFAIMREHGKNCDQAASHLASRAAVFRELGPRLMKMKEGLQGLPEQERTRIKQSSEQAMEAFKARNPDIMTLEQTAKACEKSSQAFAEIAPRVMFTKKK